jgi:multiple sugar transport system permease protein
MKVRRLNFKSSRRLVREGAILVKSGLILVLALVFVFPIVMTVLNSFMSSEEIIANYGMLFDKTRNPWEMPAAPELPWIAPTAHFKLIPDLVSAQQYIEILFKSTDYLIKFWNSVFLVLPIVAGQIFVVPWPPTRSPVSEAAWPRSLFLPTSS